MLHPSFTQPSPETHRAPSLPLYLFDERRDARFFAWWYHLTTPSAPDMLASLNAQERVRHARTISRVFLVMLLLIGFPLVFFGLNLPLIFLLTVACLVLLIVLFLNRVGQPFMAGMLLVILVEGGVLGTILLAHEDRGLTTLPLFDLLVLPLVLAASLLPLWCFLSLALLNGLFTIIVLTHGLRISSLALTFHPRKSELLFVTLLFQVVATIMAFLWKRSMTRALKRADRAEAIARLEHDLAGQGRILAEQKQQLEDGIQQIIDIQMRVAQGDLKVRIPLDDPHVLWQLAGLLNTLLARYQQALHAEEELQRTRLAGEYLLRGIRNAKQHHHGLSYDKTGAMLDAVVMELQRPVSVEAHPVQRGREEGRTTQ